MSILFDQDAPVMVVKSLFDKYDEDQNGKLDSKKELSQLLDNELGLSKEEQEICALLLDKEANGMVSFDEFREWFANSKNFKNIADPTRYDILLNAVVYFRKYDLDENDSLDLNEFKRLHSDLGGDPRHIQQALKSIDKDKNGIVSFTEFLKWLNWVDI